MAISSFGSKLKSSGGDALESKGLELSMAVHRVRVHGRESHEVNFLSTAPGERTKTSNWLSLSTAFEKSGTHQPIVMRKFVVRVAVSRAFFIE